MVMVAPLTLHTTGAVAVAVIVPLVASMNGDTVAVLAIKPALKSMTRRREKEFFTAMLGEGTAAARSRLNRHFMGARQVIGRKQPPVFPPSIGRGLSSIWCLSIPMVRGSGELELRLPVGLRCSWPPGSAEAA